MTKDLINRADALAAIALGDTVNQLQAKILAIPAAALPAATAQAAQIAGLQRTYEELYADALADAKSDAQEFDSDLWKMVRAYLDELHFDWRDFMEDGVTADEAMTHIRECMNEEARRAEAAETALTAMTKERDEHHQNWQRAFDANLRWLTKCEAQQEALAAERAKVAKLVEAGKALGLREIVAGWNGEGKEKPYTPHPAHLRATIKTTCGAVYALDAAITEAGQ